jgi:hypothetical protein
MTEEVRKQVRKDIHKSLMTNLEFELLNTRYLHKVMTRMQLSAKTKGDEEGVKMIEEAHAASKKKAEELQIKLDCATELWGDLGKKGE